MDKKDILIVIACKEESNNQIEKLGLDLLYTGVGKINATYNLTKKLCERKNNNTFPKYVINVGTTGSNRFKKGELVLCNKFIQIDMDCRDIDYPLGVTPYDNDSYLIEHKKIFDDLKYAVCGTGDNFTLKECEIKEVDVCDMEGYAFAKVCKNENIDFIAIKYISNGLVEESKDDWNKYLDDAGTSFYNYLIKKLK